MTRCKHSFASGTASGRLMIAVLAVGLPAVLQAQVTPPVTGGMVGPAPAARAVPPAAPVPAAPPAGSVPTVTAPVAAPAATPATAPVPAAAPVVRRVETPPPGPAAQAARPAARPEAHAAPLPDSRRGEFLGARTRAVFALQASGARGGEMQPVLGSTAGRSWERYLGSFQREIPEFFEGESAKR